MRMQMPPPSALGAEVFAPKAALAFTFRHEEDASTHLRPVVHPSDAASMTMTTITATTTTTTRTTRPWADASPTMSEAVRQVQQQVAAVQPDETVPKSTLKSKKDVFVCPEVHCGKQFPRSFALRRHLRIHTGTKPYACDYQGCSQRFNTSGNLSRHKRIHSGERPYPCSYENCGKRFNTSTKLKRHMRIHFPDGHNLFRCGEAQCSWACDNYKEFVQHQKLHMSVTEGFATDENASSNTHVNANGLAKSDGLKASRVMPMQSGVDARNVEFPQQVQQSVNDEYYQQDRSRLFAVDNDYRRLSVLPTKSFMDERSQPPPRLPFPTRAFPSESVMPSSGLLGSSFHLSHLPPSSHRYFDPTVPASTVEMTSSTNPSYSYAPTQAPDPHYSSYMSSYQPSSTSTSYLSTSEQYSQSLRQEDVDRHYESSSPHEMRQQPQQQSQTQYGSNPVPPEFTGEELSAVLELMKDS